MAVKTKCINLSLPQREELSLSFEVDSQDKIVTVNLQGKGSLSYLRFLQTWREKFLGQNFQNIELPDGDSTSEMLLREACLKVCDDWKPPYQDEIFCHCRGIPSTAIDLAVLSGADSLPKVRRATSASTGCGTCGPDVERWIQFRHNKKAS
jgi:NAD(P)H-nitrite reductase large subunit